MEGDIGCAKHCVMRHDFKLTFDFHSFHIHLKDQKRRSRDFSTTNLRITRVAKRTWVVLAFLRAVTGGDFYDSGGTHKRGNPIQCVLADSNGGIRNWRTGVRVCGSKTRDWIQGRSRVVAWNDPSVDRLSFQLVTNIR